MWPSPHPPFWSISGQDACAWLEVDLWDIWDVRLSNDIELLGSAYTINGCLAAMWKSFYLIYHVIYWVPEKQLQECTDTITFISGNNSWLVMGTVGMSRSSHFILLNGPTERFFLTYDCNFFSLIQVRKAPSSFIFFLLSLPELWRWFSGGAFSSLYRWETPFTRRWRRASWGRAVTMYVQAIRWFWQISTKITKPIIVLWRSGLTATSS